MTQLSLLDSARIPPHSGRTPTARECSREASLRAIHFSGTQRERALVWWRAQGARGGTDAECSEATGISRQALCQRRKELMDEGLLVATTRKRRNRAGFRCTVYVAVEFAS